MVVELGPADELPVEPLPGYTAVVCVVVLPGVTVLLCDVVDPGVTTPEGESADVVDDELPVVLCDVVVPGVTAPVVWASMVSVEAALVSTADVSPAGFDAPGPDASVVPPGAVGLVGVVADVVGDAAEELSDPLVLSAAVVSWVVSTTFIRFPSFPRTYLYVGLPSASCPET